MSDDQPQPVGLDLVEIEHDLTMPFAIAGGGMDAARALIVRVTLEDGTTGLGECAPFPAVSGETVASTRDALSGIDPRNPSPRIVAPAARCGWEQALLDARLRAAGRTVLEWMAPAVDTLETDITLPVGPLGGAVAFVDDAVSKGFRTLKVKVGGRTIAEDVELLAIVHSTFPELEIILDGNCAYDLDGARLLLSLLDAAGVPIALLEQPLAPDALDDSVVLQGETDAVVCLDESLRSAADLEAILRRPALRSINVKTMKLGLTAAVEVLLRAADAGLACMIGAMVESKLSITVSAALAMHAPETVRWIDLDTPLFMRTGPIVGGVVYDGPTVSVPPDMTGHGCSLRPQTELSV